MFTAVEDPVLLADPALSLDALFFDASCAASAKATSCQADSPLSDELGSDDLVLLNQLLNDFDATSSTTGSSDDEVVSVQRGQCADCATHQPQRSRKRRRTSSVGSADAKPANKAKSQSQRQKEEIALLKSQAEELNVKLATLQERKRKREMATTDCESETSDDDPKHDGDSTEVVERKMSLWQGVASRQESELRAAEKENKSLKDEVAKRWKQMKSLERSIITSQIEQLRETKQDGLASELSVIVSSM